jgi:hypothetical protein
MLKLGFEMVSLESIQAMAGKVYPAVFPEQMGTAAVIHKSRKNNRVF